MNRFAVFFICLLPLMAWAQTQPSVDPQGTYITVEGEEIEDASASQSAPLVAHFAANPSNVGDYSARFEWKIWNEGDLYIDGGGSVSCGDIYCVKGGCIYILKKHLVL